MNNQPAPVHACPPNGSGLMPCCGRTPFEAISDRMTSDPTQVTCGRPGSCSAAAEEPEQNTSGGQLHNPQLHNEPVGELAEPEPCTAAAILDRIRHAWACADDAPGAFARLGADSERLRQIIAGEVAPNSLAITQIAIACQVNVDWLIDGTEPLHIGPICGCPTGWSPDEPHHPRCLLAEPEPTSRSAATAQRLAELAALQPGWYDGDGQPMSRQTLATARRLVTALPHALGPIHIYPTVAGGIELEWRDYTGTHSIEIDPDQTLLLFSDDQPVSAPCDHRCNCGHDQKDHSATYCGRCQDPCNSSGHYPDDCNARTIPDAASQSRTTAFQGSGPNLEIEAETASQVGIDAASSNETAPAVGTTYFCPTSGDVESSIHGGFDTCCDRPDLHRPVATPLNAPDLHRVIETAVYELRERLPLWDESDGTTQAIAERVHAAVVGHLDAALPDRAQAAIRTATEQVVVRGQQLAAVREYVRTSDDDGIRTREQVLRILGTSGREAGP